MTYSADNPFTVNGFNGTWQFSEHSRIPECLQNYIIECFPEYERFKRIPLEDINRAMNEVWEGPGSLEKVWQLAREMRYKRYNTGTASSSATLEPVKTIDDYSEADFASTAPGLE